jgi:hypothetical protein
MIIKADGVYNFPAQKLMPFEIFNGESPNSVRVNYGKCFYEQEWKEPVWAEGGDFDTDKLIDGSEETLSLLVRYDAYARKITEVIIGWDQSHPTQEPIQEVRLLEDFLSTTFGDGFGGGEGTYVYSIQEQPDQNAEPEEMLFDIATVTVSGEDIEVEQFIDYDVIIPPRVGLIYEFFTVPGFLP